MSRRASMQRVVVGVDGSPSSLAALAWAVPYAEAMDARLLTVHAYDVPDVPLGAMDAFPVHNPEVLERAAFGYLTGVVRDMGATDLTDFVVVRDRLPARALLDATAGADLLVVGSRGSGRLARLLLGSVSRVCVHGASCPVVVVQARLPAQRQPATTRSAARLASGSWSAL
jgi:nucleotide-binding universal stress UspA family protein